MSRKPGEKAYTASCGLNEREDRRLQFWADRWDLPRAAVMKAALLALLERADEGDVVELMAVRGPYARRKYRQEGRSEAIPR